MMDPFIAAPPRPRREPTYRGAAACQYAHAHEDCVISIARSGSSRASDIAPPCSFLASQPLGMPTWFYVDKCPCKDDCSSSSWKKAKVWGWSEKSCKEQLKNHLAASLLHKQLQKKGSDAINQVVADTPAIKWDEDTESEALGSRSRSRSRSPPRPTVASGTKEKKKEKGKGEGKGTASGSTGVWAEADGQDCVQVLVDREELQSLVEDVRIVLHNAERLLRHSSEV